MKVVLASGGIGNMMFQYGLVIAFRRLGYTTLLFVSQGNSEHNGYELEKVFPNVKPYKGFSALSIAYYKLLGKFRNITILKHKIPHRILFFPIYNVYTKEAVYYYPEILKSNHNKEFYGGQYQSWKYFIGHEDYICKAFTFNISLLTTKTKSIWKQIETCNSVSLHIRRGDYLSNAYSHGLGSVCDANYYERAIKEICSKVENPHFYIFSDDKEYIKQHYSLSNMTIIDFNKGKDSWQDMFLMSQCKHNIIANSTFSWWGAFLNKNDKKIVIAPKRWWALIDDDEVIPDEWIRL